MIDKFEESSEEWRCDKWIAWIKSCRECIFEALCKFNPYYKKKNDNWQQQKNTMSCVYKNNGLS